MAKVSKNHPPFCSVSNRLKISFLPLEHNEIGRSGNKPDTCNMLCSRSHPQLEIGGNAKQATMRQKIQFSKHAISFTINRVLASFALPGFEPSQTRLYLVFCVTSFKHIKHQDFCLLFTVFISFWFVSFSFRFGIAAAQCARILCRSEGVWGSWFIFYVRFSSISNFFLPMPFASRRVFSLHTFLIIFTAFFISISRFIPLNPICMMRRLFRKHE